MNPSRLKKQYWIVQVALLIILLVALVILVQNYKADSGTNTIVFDTSFHHWSGRILADEVKNNGYSGQYVIGTGNYSDTANDVCIATVELAINTTSSKVEFDQSVAETNKSLISSDQKYFEDSNEDGDFEFYFTPEKILTQAFLRNKIAAPTAGVNNGVVLDSYYVLSCGNFTGKVSYENLKSEFKDMVINRKIFNPKELITEKLKLLTISKDTPAPTFSETTTPQSNPSTAQPTPTPETTREKIEPSGTPNSTSLENELGQNDGKTKNIVYNILFGVLFFAILGVIISLIYNLKKKRQ